MLAWATTIIVVGARDGGLPGQRNPQFGIGTDQGVNISGDRAEAYGCVNRALPDAELDGYVESLAERISGFDKWAIAQTKRLVNISLPPDVEFGAGWEACIASLGRPAARNRIEALTERGFQKPGDVENRLGDYIGELARQTSNRAS